MTTKWLRPTCTPNKVTHNCPNQPSSFPNFTPGPSHTAPDLFPAAVEPSNRPLATDDGDESCRKRQCHPGDESFGLLVWSAQVEWQAQVDNKGHPCQEFDGNSEQFVAFHSSWHFPQGDLEDLARDLLEVTSSLRRSTSRGSLLKEKRQSHWAHAGN
jgi:hypothetical protein